MGALEYGKWFEIGNIRILIRSTEKEMEIHHKGIDCCIIFDSKAIIQLKEILMKCFE